MNAKSSVLIVDDEFGVLESLRMILKPYYEILTAADGEEALEVFKEQKIDLITLDLKMPKLLEIETLREIRKIDGETPVIIITGYGTQKDEKEALHYGVTDFISKPFNTSQIISVIERMLGERIENQGGDQSFESLKGN